MKRSLLLTLMAITGTAILAAGLVGFRLSQGGLDYTAYAHIHDYTGDTINDFHVEIDGDALNGTGPCNPVDALVDVAPGTHEVAICVASPGLAISATTLKLSYDDTLNDCVDKGCLGADTLCLDSNPDLNDGATLGSGVPTSPDLGDGWDCKPFGAPPPNCDSNAATGPGNGLATIDCLSLSGPWTSPVGDVQWPLAVVTFNAIGFGLDSMGLVGIVIGDDAGGELGSCNDVVGIDAYCEGADVNKVTPLPATDTPTPLPTNTPVPATATNTPVPGVRMEKDCDTVTEGVQTSCNLWLMADGSTVPEQGKGCLVIDKWVFGIADVDDTNDLDLLPEGLGAWEEQIRFDHKILSVSAVPDNEWLESEGRIAICTMVVLTEDWILTGCVTKDDTAVPGIQVGPEGDGIIEQITVCPNLDDLLARPGDFRPTKDNGILTYIEDDNCEVTDIYGEQLPGTLPGQLTVVCGDVSIFVRMLQGDLDLDCDVDVSDDQAIAFRYGSGWGNGVYMADLDGDTVAETPVALYAAWYDLEPKWRGGDGDIDIKDLQFVFGRNWSTCQAPIPDDQALPVQPPIP